MVKKSLCTFFKRVIQVIWGIIVIALSTSSPFIISFGTFSGLIVFLELYFFSLSIDKGDYKTVYSIYLVFLWIIAIYNTNSYREISGKKNEDRLSEDENSQRSRNKVLKYFFTGGLSNLIDWWMERQGITLYDIFKRRSYWENYDLNQKEYPIIRFSKANSISYEIRFPKSKRGKILIRETAPNEMAYGDFREENLISWWFIFPLVPLSFLRQLIIG